MKTCAHCCQPFEPRVFEGEVFGTTIRFDCHYCSDECMNAAKAAKRAKEDHAKRAKQWEDICPAGYRDTDPTHPDMNQATLRRVLAWRPGGKGLALTGSTGLCKTRMMYLLLRELHFSGVNVFAICATRFEWHCQTRFDDEDKEEAKRVLTRMARVPVLFFDDLGKESLSDSVERRLYDLVETRTGKALPILWTTNLNRDELEKRMRSGTGEPILRRLKGSCDFLRLSSSAPKAQPQTSVQRRAA